MAEPLTDFDPDSERLLVFQECMDCYDVGNLDDEWPNNIVSRSTVVYGTGVIARAGDPVEHRVDPEELDLCRRLAAEACRIMEGTDVGMGSCSDGPLREFYIAANVDDPMPDGIDAEYIRSKFGGTLFPLVTITVEPLAESGIWWSEVVEDGGGEEDEDIDEYLQPWRAMIAWFRGQSELTSPVFVRIGESNKLLEIPRDQYPPGTELTGCVLPRMAVGLSPHGSLVGICGYTVHA